MDTPLYACIDQFGKNEHAQRGPNTNRTLTVQDSPGIRVETILAGGSRSRAVQREDTPLLL
jgi:hypothetical protein